jgi:hypothetical protein
MAGTVRVEGLRELERAFRRVDKEETKLLRKELKEAAEPVKVAAQGKALGSIRRMRRSPRWAEMRVGQARSLVYMVPKQRGRNTKRHKTRYARPNLKNLLLDRAMIPALEQNTTQVTQRVQHVLDTIGRQWERG